MIPKVRSVITMAFTIPARYREGANRIRTVMGGIFQRDPFFRYLSAQKRKETLIKVMVY